MTKPLSDADIKALEKQLCCPEGSAGIEVGKTMDRTNRGMTHSSIEFLELRPLQSVLELGHGNCGHLNFLLSFAKGLHYYGLEVSETMWQETQENNRVHYADFKHYDGTNIPYPDAHFDRIMSVNTLYFWQQPEQLMQEISRTLKPHGLCVLTYADKTFMETLPFVGDHFKLYDTTAIKRLVASSTLEIVSFKTQQELVTTKDGRSAERTYHMVKLKQP